MWCMRSIRLEYRTRSHLTLPSHAAAAVVSVIFGGRFLLFISPLPLAIAVVDRCVDVLVVHGGSGHAVLC